MMSTFCFIQMTSFVLTWPIDCRLARLKELSNMKYKDTMLLIGERKNV